MLVYLARHARPVFDPQRIEHVAADAQRHLNAAHPHEPARAAKSGAGPIALPTEAELLRESRLSPRGEAQAAHLARVLFEETAADTGTTTAERGVELVLRAPTGVCAATVSIMESIWSRESRTRTDADLPPDHIVPKTRVTQALAPGASVREALDLIHEHAGLTRGGLLLIGHNPQLGELLATLAGGVGARNLILRSGELIALEVRANQPIGTARVCGRWLPVAVGSLQLAGAGAPEMPTALASRRAA